MRIGLILIAFLLLGPRLAGMAQVAELEKELSTARSDTQKLRLYTELHWLLLYENPARARQLALAQIQMAEGKPQLEAQLAQGYNDLGICEQVDARWMEAIDWHEKSLQIRTRRKDLYGQASSLSKIALSYGEMGDYEKCLLYNLKSLPLFEKLNHQAALARLHANLAANYTWLKQWKQAGQSAQKAEQLARQLGDSIAMAQAWTLQAQVQQENGNLESAIQLENQALLVFERLQDTAKLMATLNNLAMSYGLQNKKTESRDLYRKAWNMARQSQSVHDEIQFAANLAAKEWELGHVPEALSLLEAAENASYQQGNHRFLPQIYRSWGLHWASRGMAQKANDYYLKASRLQDSLLSETFASQYARYQNAYDQEKKAREKEALQTEIDRQAAQLLRQRLWISVAGLSAGLLLVFLYFRSKNKKEKARRLAEMQRHAEQEKLAHEILQAEEKERTRIARELHDGVGQQLVAAFLNLENYQQENGAGAQHIQNARLLLEDSLQEIRSVSHTMLSNALLRSGLAGAIRDFIQKLKTKLSIQLDIQDLEIRIDPTLELVLFRILQELVGNIIRHAQASEIYIQLFQEDGSIVLMVEDNGIGFDPEKQENSGVGLQNIRTRTELAGGRIEINTQPGRGCHVLVKVPLS